MIIESVNNYILNVIVYDSIIIKCYISKMTQQDECNI